MSLAIVEKPVEFFVDWILISDSQAVQAYVDDLRKKYPDLDRRAIAQKIVDEQAWNNGLWGAATGCMGTLMIPFTLPFDVIKSWKIQDFTIKAIAYLYGYTPQNCDLQTAIFLLLANGSMEELKQFAISESANFVTQTAFNTVDVLKTSTIQVAAKEAPKYAATAWVKSGSAMVRTLGMEAIAKQFAEFLWKVCGKKMTEQFLQRSLSLTVPILGAGIGGGIDWITTQAVGNLTIEFFENAGIDFIHSLLAFSVAAR
jgi:hypothetical protein